MFRTQKGVCYVDRHILRGESVWLTLVLESAVPLGRRFSSVSLVDSMSIVFIPSKKRTLSSMPLENVAFFLYTHSVSEHCLVHLLWLYGIGMRMVKE